MVVEFVLNEASAPPPHPVRRSRERGNPGAQRNEPRPSRESGNPVTSSALPRLTEEPESLGSRFRGDDEALREGVRLFATDGSLRIPSTLSEDIAPKVVEGPNTFHIPAGDTWILREPKAPIEYVDTRFSQVFLPDGMNPVEEACWRNKGFAFIMSMLGSLDCAAPGQKDPRPEPRMIVYGVDDADDILRKTEDWARYNER